MRSLRIAALILLIGAAAGVTPLFADDWSQWLGNERDGVWREKGLLDKFPAGGPTVRWRTPIAEGYSGPAVVDGRVYITDFLATKPVKGADPFARNPLAGKERVFCLNESDGKVIWKYEYDCTYSVSYPAGPRCTPIVDGGRVYTLGAMGNLVCLEAKQGLVVWTRDLPKDYDFSVPLWGFSGHPIVDGNRLICLVGGQGSVAVAFNKDTGKEIWKALSAKEPGYCSPILINQAGKRQLILWHPESVNSLDPETGKVYWSVPFGNAKIGGGKSMVKAGMTIPTPKLSGDRLFLTCFYDGPLMLKLDADKPGAQVAWRGNGRGELPDQTDGLHGVMCTPVFKDGYIYGICSYGELRCLDAATGKRLWSTRQPTTGDDPVRWANAFIVEAGDRFILFNEKGDLILAKFSPKGYEEISRANILVPTNTMATQPAGRRIIWSHPAFANRCVYARNDREIVCISLAK